MSYNNTTVTKELGYIMNDLGLITQLTPLSPVNDNYLYKDYTLKKIIISFQIYQVDVPKTIPFEIYRETVNTIPAPSVTLLYTANCVETTTDLYGNRVFTFDVDIPITGNGVIDILSGSFVSGTQNIFGNRVTLVLE